MHACGSAFEAAAGDPLTQRTLPLFFDVVRLLLAGGVTVVAEAAFQDRLWTQGLEPLADLAHLRVVQTHVDPAVAWDRYRAADRAGGRPAHARIIGAGLDEWTRAYASFERLSIAAPSIDVDTTEGYEPDLAELVGFVGRR